MRSSAMPPLARLVARLAKRPTMKPASLGAVLVIEDFLARRSGAADHQRRSAIQDANVELLFVEARLQRHVFGRQVGITDRVDDLGHDVPRSFDHVAPRTPLCTAVIDELIDRIMRGGAGGDRQLIALPDPDARDRIQYQRHGRPATAWEVFYPSRIGLAQWPRAIPCRDPKGRPLSSRSNKI
jgi:hypothetical protein